MQPKLCWVRIKVFLFLPFFMTLQSPCHGYWKLKPFHCPLHTDWWQLICFKSGIGSHQLKLIHMMPILRSCLLSQIKFYGNHFIQMPLMNWSIVVPVRVLLRLLHEFIILIELVLSIKCWNRVPFQNIWQNSSGMNSNFPKCSWRSFLIIGCCVMFTLASHHIAAAFVASIHCTKGMPKDSGATV